VRGELPTNEFQPRIGFWVLQDIRTRDNQR